MSQLSWIGWVTDVLSSSPLSMPPGTTCPYYPMLGGKATSFHNNQSLEWKQQSKQLPYPVFCFHSNCCWDNQMFVPSDNFLFVYPGHLMHKWGHGWKDENSAGSLVTFKPLEVKLDSRDIFMARNEQQVHYRINYIYQTFPLKNLVFNYQDQKCDWTEDLKAWRSLGNPFISWSSFFPNCERKRWQIIMTWSLNKKGTLLFKIIYFLK